MKYRSPISVAELIEIIRNNEDHSESYCIYGRGDSSEATLTSVCYLDSYPVITDDYDEVFPEFVNDNNLEMWFREELVQDVILNAEHQNPDVSNSMILEAIKYYDEKDCFMDV